MSKLQVSSRICWRMSKSGLLRVWLAPLQREPVRSRLNRNDKVLRTSLEVFRGKQSWIVHIRLMNNSLPNLVTSVWFYSVHRVQNELAKSFVFRNLEDRVKLLKHETFKCDKCRRAEQRESKRGLLASLALPISRRSQTTQDAPCAQHTDHVT